jgi:hypothetical protein
MAFALVHRIIADATRLLARVDPPEFEKKEAILHQTEADLKNNYLLDTANLSHKVVAAFAEVRIASLRLSNRHCQIQKAASQPSDLARHQ